jgi:polyhydroxyalkanoate synthesis regulator phasin
MASLFDVVNRRRRSKELADKFREGATPDELEYFDRFYQEPSSSPVMARGALSGELDAADALQRQLMARGMNNLQAQDATRRALAQEEAELDRTAQSIATQYGPGGLYGTGEGSYEEHKRSIPQIDTGGAAEFLAQQGLPSPEQQQPLNLDDWSRQRAMARQDASGVSAESKARYEEQTVDDRISMIEEQAKSLPAELQAKGASAEVTTAYMQELGRQIQITRENAPDTPQGRTKQGAAKYQSALTAVENLHKLYKGTSGGGGFSSYGAQGFIDAELEQGITQSQQSGAIVGEEGGQQLMAPRQTHVEGEYQK